MIKVDFHMHTGEDPYDGLRYPATALIDKAVALEFGAIAITLHDRVLDDSRIFDYARARGLLLIPAAEWTIEGVDVLMINVTQAEVERVKTFADLRALRDARGESLLTIAPHPYYPIGHSLKHHLERHIELFDAIEHAQVHLPWLNFNKQARRIATHYQKPMVANSDTHNLWMFGRHYTRVEAEPEILAIFRAIRANRLEWVSPPITIWECLKMFLFDPMKRRPGEQVWSFPPATD